MVPNQYEAKARFYVDTGSRLREVVQNLGMEPNVASRVFLVRQAMMGRPQLEKVARETDLDISVTSEEEMEVLINNLRENIAIGTGRRNQAQNLFNIVFSHRDRVVAERVVSALLNSFYDDVLQQKDSDTERTQEFLEEQLSYYRELLTSTEEKLQLFKRDHPGFVVGDRGDYFARMQTENDQLRQLTTDHSVELGRRDELRRQLQSVSPYRPAEDVESISLIPGNETSQQLSELDRQRRQLLLRVTEVHPDVLALDEQISQLKQQLESELLDEAASTGLDGASSATNPVYVEIQIALSNSNLRLAGLEGEISQSKAQIARLRAEVDQAPELERVYINLTRDYANYQGLYNEVLNQSERERIGRVGDTKDVISFNTIDPPRAGLEPTSPNRPLLLTAILAVGLALGAGTAFVLWFVKPTIHNVGELANLARYPVIGTVRTNLAQVRQGKVGSILLFGSCLGGLILTYVAVVVVSAPASLWLRNTIELAIG